MKAKDLTVGMECYHHRSNSWDLDYEEGERAVIVDPTPGNWIKERDGSWTRVSNAEQKVLVDIHRNATPHVARYAVRTQTLRGPWEECRQQRTQARAAKAEAARARQDAQKDRLMDCQLAVQALGELGITAVREGYVGGGFAKVVVSGASVALLMAAAQQLDAIGWNARTEGAGA